MQTRSERIEIWEKNDWLKDALYLELIDDGIHYTLAQYLEACQKDLAIEKQSKVICINIASLEFAIAQLQIVLAEANQVGG